MIRIVGTKCWKYHVLDEDGGGEMVKRVPDELMLKGRRIGSHDVNLDKWKKRMQEAAQLGQYNDRPTDSDILREGAVLANMLGFW